MTASADVARCESQTHDDLNDADLTEGERLMLRGLVESGVAVLPGKRYTLSEVAAIVRSSTFDCGEKGGRTPHEGKPLTVEAADALVRDEGESEAMSPLRLPKASRERLARAQKRFVRSFETLPESERMAILDEAGVCS